MCHASCKLINDISLYILTMQIYLKPVLHHVTYQAGVEVKLSILFGRCLVRISAGKQAILTEVLRGFPQVLHVNATMKLQMSHSKSFPINCSLSIVLFDAIKCQLLRA
jgi:hypothetical protein